MGEADGQGNDELLSEVELTVLWPTFIQSRMIGGLVTAIQQYSRQSTGMEVSYIEFPTGISVRLSRGG